MLSRNFDSMTPAADVYDEDEGEKVPPTEEIYTYGGVPYVIQFDECGDLYNNISLRTQQRDIRLVKDVIAYMFEG